MMAIAIPSKKKHIVAVDDDGVRITESLVAKHGGFHDSITDDTASYDTHAGDSRSRLG